MRDGRLAPHGPSFKALVLNNASQVTRQSFADISRLADSGLPIVIVGQPIPYPSSDAIDSNALSAGVNALLTKPNVRRASVGTVASVLADLGIAPSVTVRSQGLWYTSWRDSDSDKSSTLFVLGDTKATAGEIELETKDTPFMLDAWTGLIRPVLNYRRSSDGKKLIVPLRLAGNETAFIGLFDDLHKNVELPKVHVSKLPDTVIDLTSSDRSGIIANVVANRNVGLENAQILLSSQRAIDITRTIARTPPAMELKSWTLLMEHWEAPADLYDADVVAIKRNSTREVTAPLLGWSAINGLQNASGIASYSTSFTWPPKSSYGSSLGAYLKLPPLLHTAKLLVNGKEARAVNVMNPVVDISPQLIAGTNQITIVIPSTMWNYLRSMLGDLVSSGGPPFRVTSLNISFPVPPRTENGLIGTVVLTPYSTLRLELA